MKSLLVFLLGAICGAFVWHLYLERDGRLSPSLRTSTSAVKADAADAVDHTKDAAVNAKDSVSDKLREWKLTPDDIKADLAKTGEVVRTNAASAGERIADARIVAVIKAKFLLDRDLSALDINVDSRDGRVTLRGSVETAALIGKAVALALDTTGVHDVAAALVIK